MKFLILTLFALSITACSGGGDSRPDKNTPGNLDQTDYSSCSGAPSVGKLAGQAWHKVSRTGDVRYETTISFTADNVFLSNTCTFSGGLKLIASIDTPIRHDQEKIEILKASEKTQRFQDKTCHIALSPGQFKYSFKGGCLAISQLDGSDSDLFVPLK